MRFSFAIFLLQKVEQPMKLNHHRCWNGLTPPKVKKKITDIVALYAKISDESEQRAQQIEFIKQADTMYLEIEWKTVWNDFSRLFRHQRKWYIDALIHLPRISEICLP